MKGHPLGNAADISVDACSSLFGVALGGFNGLGCLLKLNLKATKSVVSSVLAFGGEFVQAKSSRELLSISARYTHVGAMELQCYCQEALRIVDDAGDNVAEAATPLLLDFDRRTHAALTAAIVIAF